MSADLTLPATGSFNAGLRFRHADGNNHWRAYLTATDVVLQEVVSGTVTTRGTASISGLPGSTRALRVIAVGASVKVFVNGVERLSYASAPASTATRYGLHQLRVDSSWNAVFYDNFKVSDPPLTAVFKVAQNSHDGYTHSDITNLISNTAALVVGHISSTQFNYRAYALLTPDAGVVLDQGWVIESAVLECVQHTGRTVSYPFRLAFQPADNPTVPSDKSDLVNRTRGIYTTYQYPGSWVAETPFTIDLTARVQAILNRPGYAAGNRMLLFLDPNSFGWGGQNDVHQIYSADGGAAKAPRLVITYQTPTYTGQGYAGDPEPFSMGTGEVSTVVYEGTGYAGDPEPTAEGTGTHNYPPTEGVGLVDDPPPTASGEGEVTTVTYSGAGYAVAPAGAASGTGQVTTVTVNGSARIDAPMPVASGTGTMANPPSYTATGLAYDPEPTASATGRMVPEPFAIGRPQIKERPHIRLLNRSRQVLAILDIASPPTWTRKRNEATEITLSVPRGDVKLPYTQVSTILEVWQGSRRLVSGRISGRDVAPDLVTVKAMTEEILLEQHVTPVNYSPVFYNQDLADIARRCCDSWYTLRVGRDWNGTRLRVSNGLDFATSPGVMMLRRLNGRYVWSGYNTLRFLKSEVPRFRDWERIRWSSDFDPPVFTTLQYRYQKDGVWSPWIPNRNVTVGSTTGVGVQGALPESLGLGIADAGTADFVEVRCNLYTDDIESGEEGETLGLTPIWYGLEIVARTHGHVAVGNIPGSTGTTVRSVDADAKNGLSILREAAEQVGFEFRVENGRLDIAREFGRRRTDDFLLTG